VIVSRTPFRMSFVGGGTDIPVFYREEMGAVISTAIDKYMYVVLHKKFDNRIRLSYSRTEDVARVDEISHPLIRETLKLLELGQGLEIASLADIPSRGSGLGSSSSYTVGLLNALHAYRGNPVSPELLARQACEVEITRCAEPIGKQDQYAAAFGGFNLYEFHPDETVKVRPISIQQAALQDIERRILVFFTGRTRSASTILESQKVKLSERPTRLLARRMIKIVSDFKEAVQQNRIDLIGSMLHENWIIKKQLSNGISDLEIDEWYTKGIKAGAMGGKILGAGRGGFLMFFADPEFHNSIKAELSHLRVVDFKFEKLGSVIVLNT
jgi:D-glycero-alpha-D-manno-heptose-7-phosphate kinase